MFDKEKLKKDVEDIIIQIIEEDILGQYSGLDCFYEDNELSDEEIEYIQSLSVCSLVLMNKD